MIKAIVIIGVLLWSALVVIGITMADRIHKRVDDLGVLIGTRLKEMKQETETLRAIMEIESDSLQIRVGKQLGYEMEQLNCLKELGKMIESNSDKIDDFLLQTMAPLAADPEGGDLPDRDDGEITLPADVQLDDKAAICSELARLLKMTMAGEDIESITYEKVSTKEGFTCEEYAIIEWETGHKQAVTITADSGKAIIADVLRWI